MTDLPEIGYGTVNGRYLAGTSDSGDPASAPDAVPMAGTVEFWSTASVVLVGGAVPTPVTLMPQRVCAVLDAEGYLANPDTGSRDITLFCTDDPDGNPVDWQWRAVFHLTYQGRNVVRPPFNFALPCGTRVDLTTVSPVAEPSPGTIIIQGPPGKDGAFDASIIQEQGDLLVGTGPAAFTILPPGAPGDALTPDPAAPTGLIWGPPAAGPGGDGLKVYATIADLDPVRTAEVGTLHVANLAASFPALAASHPGAFGGTGPADLVITSTPADHSDPDPSDFAIMLQSFSLPSSSAPGYVDVWRTFFFLKSTGAFSNGGAWQVKAKPGTLVSYYGPAALDDVRTAEIGTLHVEDMGLAFPALKTKFPTLFPPYPGDLLVFTSMTPQGVNVRSFHQRFAVADGANYYFAKWFVRNMQRFGPSNSDWNGPPYNWAAEAALPDGSAQGWTSLRSEGGSGAQGWVVGPYIGVSDLNPDSIALRDAAGRSQFATPVAPTDAANKKYVDDAIAAAIAALP